MGNDSARAVSGGNEKALAAAASVLAILAVVLGIIARGSNVLGWDLSFGAWIQQWDGSFGEAVYRVGDMLGTTSLAAVITGIGIIVALVLKRAHIAIFLVLVLALRVVGIGLKPLFDSPRPTAEHLRIMGTFDGTGYPSGHSMTAAMVATMLVLLVWRYVDSLRVQWLITIIASMMVLLVGWSRVWAGAHWPSDVLGGWSFGFALTAAAWMLGDVLVTLPILRRDTIAEHATG